VNRVQLGPRHIGTDESKTFHDAHDSQGYQSSGMDRPVSELEENKIEA
jgi:hypothetical protein